jgi:hypothetical protein
MPKISGGSQGADVNAIADQYLKSLTSKGITIPKIEAAIPESGNIIKGVQQEAARFGVELGKKGFEQPTDVSHSGAATSQLPRIATAPIRQEPLLISEERGTPAEVQTAANRELAPRLRANNEAARAPEEAKYDQLQKIRDRLGIKKHSYASDATEVPAQDIERARVRSSAKYDYTEKPKGDSMRHTVTATDAKGNHLATVEATSSADGTQWTIRGSVSDVDPKLRANIGEEAYSKLFRSAADKASKTGQSVTIHADPDLLTPSGVRVWERLEKEFPQIKWEGKSVNRRPSITFEAKKPSTSTPLPQAMGGKTPEPENNTFMGSMKKYMK